ncbi:hypothetical protein AVEN_104320-1 [Araneus ventricosus]|uniref:Uncharacterized protein n=1 Tax=Araneus ventricosus TaxID=182803 RepID=A0A4Y2BUY3_ARAVE|nr:hypothetical protein AVEN_104320-1 [Araneus ventricosus]
MDDQYIVLQTKRYRYQSAGIIAQQLIMATSLFTAAKCLHKGGLSVRRPKRCIPLRDTHQQSSINALYASLRSTKAGGLINGVMSS